MRLAALAAVISCLLAGGATAPPWPEHPAAESQALDLAEKAIALRSVAGPGDRTPEVASLFKAALVAGGFDPDEVTITPVDDTAYLIARWRGADPKLGALVISGHMDVVEAKPADWRRDPFTPVVENGYLFGRGSADMKLGDALAVASLVELKRQGFKPRRDIVLEFSGDEETAMKTSALVADKLANADLVVDIDGTGGTLNETSGQREYFTWQGAEKTYADFQLTVTNPGGHSSRPRGDNAINELAAALVRIGRYHFTPELNDLTRSYFTKAADYERPEIAAAMRAFAANPRDAKAIATLTAEPAMVGAIGTTCVATMLSGGHALNALPQRAQANINCRIFPGHKPAEIMAELKRVAAEPSLTIADVSEGSVPTDASPMRPDLMTAVGKAMEAVYPGVPVFPSMMSGASDAMWFRHHGVASYGVSPMFIKRSDDFSHGLNERIPMENIRPSIDFFLVLIPELSK